MRDVRSTGVRVPHGAFFVLFWGFWGVVFWLLVLGCWFWGFLGCCFAAPRQVIDREAYVNAFFVNDDVGNKQPGQMESVSLEEPEKVEEAAARDTAASVTCESDATGVV